ncbi:MULTISPECIES: cytochrome c oxidase subunit 3 [Chromobacterium]|uniref:cytochrome-c oxidase n=1 Tax=Chromobacterium haemolyticum TaxID=394935 RepID=A0ABS3GG06_9NEIS|nr:MULTISPECIES: cytochrome c oxidase subunit 3 [Chromobacterium]MBK0412885.1 cytochrome c oxidase subunit 3 [Chromobacterium haemolyticum]MBO0413987.1 cytochrome c oxidase subunit 3 [Chromobacterium haemolyticum]MBO0497247.1 cytochrome c oxidase subunit 3 [Chromobacterium haemolyticum]MDH0341858.1 cytochrome c oxidase subunit 3 [Chromobacterium haemolyticum]OQS37065.1 cytochrome c oxidase subunit 3 [Chromobacterium haemolyticum]
MTTANEREQTHYFVPQPSRWPAVGAVALFCLGLGAAFAVNGQPLGKLSLGVGALILIYMLFGWFGDVIRESRHGDYQGKEDMSFRWGMGWFIFSEVMFFGAFFGALYWVRVVSVPTLGEMDYKILYPDFEPSWPLLTGPGITKPYQAMGAWGLPALNTLILLSSGAMVTWAHWALLQGRRAQLKLGLLLTVLLGTLFLCLQMYEYGHAMSELNLSLASGAYGMTFFMLTGFHGMHVLLGTIILAVVWLRVMRGHFDGQHHFAFEAAAWYWHFVDVVWLLLFVFVYWL